MYKIHTTQVLELFFSNHFIEIRIKKIYKVYSINFNVKNNTLQLAEMV